MSRIVQSGFESGDIAAAGASSNGGGNSLFVAPTVVSASPTARSGTYSLKCAMSSDTTATGFIRQTFSHASLTESWYAFGLYRNNGGDSGSLPGAVLWHNLDSAGNVNLALTCEGDGTMRLYFCSAGGGAPAGANMTLIGASSVSVPLATWTLIEIHFVAATGGTGTAEVYVAGSLGFSSTATRTCQTNANAASFAVEYWRINTSAVSTQSFMAFDDLRVNSTAGSVNNGRPNDASIVLEKPSGAGNHTGLTGTGGATNWQDVSNIPPNHSDFVSGSAGAYDTYATSGAPTVSSVEAVNYIAQAQGGANIEPTFFTGSTLNTQAAQATQASWGYIQQILETNPVSGVAWTQSDLTNLQLGVTCP